MSLDDKRSPIEANDIPDIVAKWPNREEGLNSFNISIDRIKENGWQLMIGRYKPIRVEAVHHDPPAKILEELIGIEKEIAERAEKLLKEMKSE